MPETVVPDNFAPGVFAVETPDGTVGLAVRTGSGFRFYASTNAFAGLEERRYRRIEDIQTDIDILATSVNQPVIVQQRGRRKRRN